MLGELRDIQVARTRFYVDQAMNITTDVMDAFGQGYVNMIGI